tara:strand:- start:342 stop:500 length:159 start_codon:yes stop_codon:yes gene_type:complete
MGGFNWQSVNVAATRTAGLEAGIVKRSKSVEEVEEENKEKLSVSDAMCCTDS